MGDYVELRNKEGSFYDPETELSVSRDDVVPLTEPIGRLTQERLSGGGLLRCKGPATDRQEPRQEEKPETASEPEPVESAGAEEEVQPETGEEAAASADSKKRAKTK
jgi:hypothetical protein